jgi:hypothetical protein
MGERGFPGSEEGTARSVATPLASYAGKRAGASTHGHAMRRVPLEHAYDDLTHTSGNEVVR